MRATTIVELPETKRFTTEDAPFTADDVITDDRVDPALVASSMSELGQRRSADPDAAATQLAEATITDPTDDVHTAILVDGESGVLALASRHDSQSACSQREADWKVRSVGECVVVESTEIARDENDEWDEDSATDSAQAWANVVLQDRALGGVTDYEGQLTLTDSSSLTLQSPLAPTKIHATIRLDRDPIPQKDDTTTQQ